MAALTNGTKAPEFDLKTLDGKRFSLSDELAHRPGRAGVFQSVVSDVPVCASVFRETASEPTGATASHWSAISQNDAKDTAAFNKEFGVTFPVLLDDPRSYPASNAYGLTNVPTIFWIAQDGEIEVSSVGWLKADFEEINRKMAEAGQDRSGGDVQAGRRGAGFPRGLRVEKLAAGPAAEESPSLRSADGRRRRPHTSMPHIGMLHTRYQAHQRRVTRASGHVLACPLSESGCTLVHRFGSYFSYSLG